jgi:hypothetical protein
MNKDSKSDSLSNNIDTDEMLDEYDFSHAVRRNLRQSPESLRIRIETQTGDRQIVIKTVEVTAVVSANGEVTLQLPADISPGEHRMTLLIEEIILSSSN